MHNTILVVAAHSDDEALGCGGTIAKHILEGDRVTVMFMTDGVASRDNASDNAKLREIASSKALEALGVEDIRRSNFPDNRMDTIALLDIVKDIEIVIDEIQPNIVYTHFANDLNVDHRVTHSAVMTACRPQSWSSVTKILSFEVLSSTEWISPTQQIFTPNCFVDIADFWTNKLTALQCYEEELREYPHSRSYACIKALAMLRGATNGLELAEAFQIERMIVK